VPVAIDGSIHILPKHTRRVRLGRRVTITYGAPIYPPKAPSFNTKPDPAQPETQPQTQVETRVKTMMASVQAFLVQHVTDAM
jgi:hypothetical protein